MPADALNVSVREALVSDARRIAMLALQLGYEVPVAHIERRLAAPGQEREVFTAIVPRVGVVGWVGIAVEETLIGGRRAALEGLVVDDEYRSNGVGLALLARAERWAAQHQCSTVRLYSNVVRERAHAFYLRSGYEAIKTEHVFEKHL